LEVCRSFFFFFFFFFQNLRSISANCCYTKNKNQYLKTKTTAKKLQVLSWIPKTFAKDVKNFLFYLPKITLFVFTATALNHAVPAVMPCLLVPVTKMACLLVLLFHTCPFRRYQMELRGFADSTPSSSICLYG
jgi:hypothetical protein